MNSDSQSLTSILPSDLENEPFASNDTGIRPEIGRIARTRALFRCWVEEQDKTTFLSYMVNQCDGSVRDDFSAYYRSRPTTERWKTSSEISVLDVYDNYGLAAARQYIDRLMSSDIARHQPGWILGYLVGCLEIVNMDLASDLSYRIATSSIPRDEATELAMSGLISHMILDYNTRQRPMPAELTPTPLVFPIELLARIIDSYRVSKELTKHVVHLRLTRELSLTELDHHARSQHVEMLDSLIFIPAWPTTWLIGTIDERFQLESRPFGDDLTIGDRHLVYSPRDVARARGVSTRAVLSHLRKPDVIELLCAWVVQLSHDLDLPDSLTMNRDELSSHYDTLIQRAREKWR